MMFSRMIKGSAVCVAAVAFAPSCLGGAVGGDGVQSSCEGGGCPALSMLQNEVSVVNMAAAKQKGLPDYTYPADGVPDRSQPWAKNPTVTVDDADGGLFEPGHNKDEGLGVEKDGGEITATLNPYDSAANSLFFEVTQPNPQPDTAPNTDDWTTPGGHDQHGFCLPDKADGGDLCSASGSPANNNTCKAALPESSYLAMFCNEECAQARCAADSACTGYTKRGLGNVASYKLKGAPFDGSRIDVGAAEDWATEDYSCFVKQSSAGPGVEAGKSVTWR